MRTFRRIYVDCFNRIAKNAFFVVVTFIFVFENCQNSFSCRPFFGPFWSVKYLDFGQKLPIRTAHYTFLESRQAEVTKNPYYVLSPEGSQKRYQLMDYRGCLTRLLITSKQTFSDVCWANSLKDTYGTDGYIFLLFF